MPELGAIQAQITFLYYPQIEPAAAFYGEVLGLALVEDQGWAKIYRAGGNAYLGIVAGDRGFHRPQDQNAVLVTLVVVDVERWHTALQAKGIETLSELKQVADIGVRCFCLEDPGGYALEIQQFLKPEVAATFRR